jgi:hypothetical protein
MEAPPNAAGLFVYRVDLPRLFASPHVPKSAPQAGQMTRVSSLVGSARDGTR